MVVRGIQWYPVPGGVVEGGLGLCELEHVFWGHSLCRSCAYSNFITLANVHNKTFMCIQLQAEDVNTCQDVDL